MRRLFWLGVGAGLGAWGLHKAQVKAQRFARRMTPQSIAVRTGDRMRLFAADVREGMAIREGQLRAAIEADLEVPGARDPAELRQGARRRVLKARYTIIDNEKDGH